MARYCKNSLYCSIKMKKQYSTKWKASKKPRKQRKYRFNAPLHTRRKFMAAHLSKELITKYQKRNIPIIKGDKVKIMKGQFKNKTGEITQIDIKKFKVYVDLAFVSKRDGTKSFYPIYPANLLITELKLDDKKRKEALERGIKKWEDT